MRKTGIKGNWYLGREEDDKLVGVGRSVLCGKFLSRVDTVESQVIEVEVMGEVDGGLWVFWRSNLEAT